MGSRSTVMLAKEACLPGRSSLGDLAKDFPSSASRHFTLKTPLHGPWPDGLSQITLGMGCFWCSEALFLGKLGSTGGLYSTHVGYANGVTENPTYKEVCTGNTNHNEVVRLIYDPSKLPLRAILTAFWEGHDPTGVNRQGGDVGTQYRSAIYLPESDDGTDARLANESRASFQKVLSAAGKGTITTEIEPLRCFYYAEEYHQQYSFKPNSREYCGLVPLGLKLPDGDWVSVY